MKSTGECCHGGYSGNLLKGLTSSVDFNFFIEVDFNLQGHCGHDLAESLWL